MMNVKIIQIGSMRIALPALIAVGLGIINALVIIIALPQMWYLGLISMASFFVSAYTINCSIVGHCVIWAWFLMAVLAVSSILLTISLVFSRFFTKKTANSPTALQKYESYRPNNTR